MEHFLFQNQKNVQMKENKTDLSVRVALLNVLICIIQQTNLIEEQESRIKSLEVEHEESLAREGVIIFMDIFKYHYYQTIQLIMKMRVLNDHYLIFIH